MHTPTPWQEIDGEIWNEEADKIIAANLVHPFAPAGPERLANAALIVRAVNSFVELSAKAEAHAELVAVLERCHGMFQQSPLNKDDDWLSSQLARDIRKALAKAQA